MKTMLQYINVQNSQKQAPTFLDFSVRFQYKWLHRPSKKGPLLKSV